MARSDIEGFDIAFHSSLSEPVTIAGPGRPEADIPKVSYEPRLCKNSSPVLQCRLR